MNYLQRVALQEIIKDEIRNEQKKESARFKVQAAIAYPEAAQRIFSKEEQEEVFPDIEEFDPDNPGFSDESISKMLETMEQLGFYIDEVD